MHGTRPTSEAMHGHREPRSPAPGRVSKNASSVHVHHNSAELKGPRKLLIRPEIIDFEPDVALKLGQAKPAISGTVPTNRHIAIPNGSGPISACFDDDPNLFNCEIAQPSMWAAAVPPGPGGGPRAPSSVKNLKLSTFCTPPPHSPVGPLKGPIG